ncbi:sigma 54-interacting transcriptional regulator [Agaribacter flavus]|uniref:HTH-type transcriptional regulatory protein TyrR n=1 Tax=Agaribacter flavus TaxID=1902781 RepID=A0ABV7FPG6_9ALTE
MKLEIQCENRVGILHEVLGVFNRYSISLRGIEIDKGGKLYVDCPSVDFNELQTIMPQIRLVNGVVDVKTTKFLPNQRQLGQLQALLKTFVEPVFATDEFGRIILFNDAVKATLELPNEQIVQQNINDFLDGVNISRCIEQSQSKQHKLALHYLGREYRGELHPIEIGEDNEKTVVGALIVLKSETFTNTTDYHNRASSGQSFDKIESRSLAMQKAVEEAKRMSELDENMLIIGETGTGKEHIAKACHDNSKYTEGEFVTLSCSSIAEETAEIELFGKAPSELYRVGRMGLFEQAAGGTLLLDEVGEMPLGLQAMLLKVLEYGTYHRIGDVQLKSISCRIICTSSQDLIELISEGRFREDLYYRLNVLSLKVPALRERKADIVPIANQLLTQQSKKLGKQAPQLSKSCLEYLQSYPWPGNVRQLRNALYRAISLSDGVKISHDDIQLPPCSSTFTYIDENFEGSLEQEVKKFEKDMLKKLYPSYPSTRQLARKLGLSHTAIANKLREYGINKMTARH